MEVLRKAPTITGAFLLLLFLALALAVHLRLLVGLDYATGLWARSVDIALLDSTATAMSVAFSGEFSILYGLVATIVLWRMGTGWWSLAPLGFLAVTPVEIVLKEIVHQPLPPAELTRPHLYPMIITSAALEGAFPSGYVLRMSFFSVFLALLLWSTRENPGRFTAGFCIAIAVILAFSRIYVGWHWLSDVVAGFLLGSATALLLAPPVAAKLGIPAAQGTS